MGVGRRMEGGAGLGKGLERVTTGPELGLKGGRRGERGGRRGGYPWYARCTLFFSPSPSGRPVADPAPSARPRSDLDFPPLARAFCRAGCRPLWAGEIVSRRGWGFWRWATGGGTGTGTGALSSFSSERPGGRRRRRSWQCGGGHDGAAARRVRERRIDDRAMSGGCEGARAKAAKGWSTFVR